jgi:isopentenyl-diphosphate delta-isomerase
VSGAADEIRSRKDEHLTLCAESDVEHRSATLLDEVQLYHDSLPELALSEIDLSRDWFGRRLAAPIVITGMTGGTSAASTLNRALATAAQKFGLAMGVGSQRAMLVDPGCSASFRVRDVAPDIVLFANLGAVQVRDAGLAAVEDLVADIHADALCVHLNPAQELVQDEGDRDFRGCQDAIAELRANLAVPLIVKETGCGMGPATLARLKAAGVQWVDVSGAGGTTWTGIEGLRGSERQRALGSELRNWGIPTAASVIFARRAGLSVIASGGLRSGLDCARAIAIGADAAGIALPMLRAFSADGLDGVLRATGALVEALRATALLTGARDLDGLRRVPQRIGPALQHWID